MRNPIVSPYFDEAKYKGQDVVHHGVRIPLSMAPELALEQFSRRAQRIIKESKSLGITFTTISTSELLWDLRQMWFDPNDDTFPVNMDEEGHFGWAAWQGGKLIGGILLRQQGRNLFLHQLVSSDGGKTMGVPTLLIWRAVQEYSGRWWNAIDVGVSYNPKRYEFFCNFAVQKYPIILKRPELVPVIRLAPFRIMNNLDAVGQVRLSPDSTFLPRGSYALEAALKLSGVSEGDDVVIVKTFGSNYVSGCVTRAVEKLGAKPKLRGLLHSRVKAVVVVHEFGIPVYQDSDMMIINMAREKGIPIIEDCAWRAFRVWEWSTYVVMSMPKVFPINYGGLLIGAKINDDMLWEWGMLDVFKRQRLELECAFDDGKATRVRNWLYYHSLVQEDGMAPDDCYDYAKAVNDGTWTPTVYLQKFESDEVADAVVERLEQFGIQAGRYWGEPTVFLPIHQNMTLAEVEYMFAVVRGYYNLCRDYK